jgi:hypothetical protein
VAHISNRSLYLVACCKGWVKRKIASTKTSATARMMTATAQDLGSRPTPISQGGEMHAKSSHALLQIVPIFEMRA